MTTTRRGFLIAGGAAIALLRATGARAQQPSAPVPGKDRLIVRSPRPINLEARLGDLTAYHTPDEVFFVRNNYDAARIAPAQWSVKIEGEVDNPLVLRLDDLQKLSMFTQDVTLECAGNGRSFHKPRASGIQWENGAVGNAAWKGVRLADVLSLARPRPTGRHVAFDGLDKPPTLQAGFHPQRPDLEGARAAHDDRARDERQTASALARRPGARDRPRVRRLGVRQVARADHRPRRRV